MREDKDLSQSKIAELLKIHQTTYSDYEIGNLNVPVEVIVALAKFYKTSTDYLLFMTDDPTPYK